MDKYEQEGTNHLFTLLLMMAVIVWLREIGMAGLTAFGITMVTLLFHLALQEMNREQAAFDSLARNVFKNRLDPTKTRALNRRIKDKNPDQYELLRNIRILRDSLKLSITSKKRETAESRMQMVRERFHEIKETQSHLLGSHVLDEIQRVVRHSEEEFQTILYLNAASGYIEKTQKLKTDKAKLKYLGLARETIEEGIQARTGDKKKLARAFQDVEQRITSILSGHERREPSAG